MPVDPSGATTDDHGHGGGGSERRRTGDPVPDEALVADAQAGRPPVGGSTRFGDANRSGNGRIGLPDVPATPPGRRPSADQDGTAGPAAAVGDGREPAPLDEEIAAADRLESTAAAIERGERSVEPQLGLDDRASGYPTGVPSGGAASEGAASGAMSEADASEAAPSPGPAVGGPPLAGPWRGIDPATEWRSRPAGDRPDGDGATPSRRRRVRRPRSRRRKARRGLRVRQRLWSLDPWSVFKLSALFYTCLCLILLVTGTLLWNVGRSVGTIDDIESFVTRMGAYGTCTPRADVPATTEFEEDDDCAEGEVLVGGYRLDDGTILRMTAIGGGILVAAGSVGNVLMVVLLNLLNELTGGLRHTIVKEPVPPPGGRPRDPRPAAARAAAGRAGAPRHAAPAPSARDGGGNGGPRRVPTVEGSPEHGARR